MGEPEEGGDGEGEDEASVRRAAGEAVNRSGITACWTMGARVPGSQTGLNISRATVLAVRAATMRRSWLSKGWSVEEVLEKWTKARPRPREARTARPQSTGWRRQKSWEVSR